MTNKKLAVVGVVVMVLPIVLRVVDTKLFSDCNGDYKVLPMILKWIDFLVTANPIIGILFTLLGAIILLFVYARWRKTASKTQLSVEIFFLSVISLFFVFVWLSLNCTRCSGQDPVVKSSLISLRAEVELYYDKTLGYEGLCESELIKIENSHYMKNYSFEKGSLCSTESQTIQCESDINKFAVSAKLPQGKGKYFCVDSTGFAGVTESPATGTVCPKKFIE